MAGSLGDLQVGSLLQRGGICMAGSLGDLQVGSLLQRGGVDTLFDFFQDRIMSGVVASEIESCGAFG